MFLGVLRQNKPEKSCHAGGVAFVAESLGAKPKQTGEKLSLTGTVRGNPLFFTISWQDLFAFHISFPSECRLLISLLRFTINTVISTHLLTQLYAFPIL